MTFSRAANREWLEAFERIAGSSPYCWFPFRCHILERKISDIEFILANKLIGGKEVRSRENLPFQSNCEEVCGAVKT